LCRQYAKVNSLIEHGRGLAAASAVTVLPGLLAAPPADPAARSHESLCVLNLGGEQAAITLNMSYEDSDPTVGLRS
jgi:hypothetical protein